MNDDVTPAAALAELREYATRLTETRSYQFNAEFHAVVHAILQATDPRRIETS